MAFFSRGQQIVEKMKLFKKLVDYQSIDIR